MSGLYRIRVERTQFAEFVIAADDEREAKQKALDGFEKMPPEQRRLMAPQASIEPATADA